MKASEKFGGLIIIIGICLMSVALITFFMLLVYHLLFG